VVVTTKVEIPCFILHIFNESAQAINPASSGTTIT